jgi:hypothetical protein
MQKEIKKKREWMVIYSENKKVREETWRVKNSSNRHSEFIS